VVKSYTGHLLVALPTLRDPHFERTVVFLLAHESDGALGVVLNRPTGVGVSEVLPGWETLVSGPQVLFEGGPVGADSAICVARAKAGVAGFLGYSRVIGQVGTIDLSHEPSKIGDKLDPGMIERRLIDPKSVKEDAEMPAFADKLSPEDMKAIAQWLGKRK